MLGDEFYDMYEPTVFDTFKSEAPVPFRSVPVEMWDMSGSAKVEFCWLVRVSLHSFRSVVSSTTRSAR